MLFCLLGLAAQIYLCKVYRVPRALAWAVLLCQSALFVFNLSPNASTGASGSVLMLWWWAIMPAALLTWLRRRIRTDKFSPGRRAILQSSFVALAAAPAIALGTGVVIRKALKIHEVQLKFAGLPKDLVGIRLAQISDIHLGTFYSRADLAGAVDAVNGLRADLVFVTGDLITSRYDPLDDCLLELRRLRSAGGIWGCLGNHEMHAGVENYTTRQGLRNGIRFLRQENELISFGNAKLNLVGVDHQRRDRPYLEGTERLRFDGAFNLLLSHNPDVFPVASKQGFDLTLAGHTHGGQINLEIAGGNLNMAQLVTPFTKGLYRTENSSIYVNSGLGTIGVPVRLGAPPEITLITLCAF
jgi:predicted MPP superfamily phosphohydrolase